MEIIYVSCVCSKKKFTNLFKESKHIPGQQVQKYHRLLMEGMAMNNVNVKTITALPITNQNCRKKIIKKDLDEENSVLYTYLTIFNVPVLKNLFTVIGSFFRTLKFLKDDKDAVIICDVLNISVTAGAIFAAKLLKRKNVGIVTDVPVFLSDNSISIKLNNFIMSKFDAYVFLTEQMNDLINKRKVPYSIIEGQVDIRMRSVENEIDDKCEQRVCIYAGGLQKIYGIKYLVKAFIKADLEKSELHLYGNGDFEEELIEICKENKNIKYFGVIPNDEVVEAEIKATLLINPRPTNEEYTKYSFPSKNMEYMVSGTPILTTKLPGMPEEYYDYIYIIDGENVDETSIILKNILAKDPNELHEKGLNAKQFVLKEKNNIVQANKILKLISSI